jgi:hypothetical protein
MNIFELTQNEQTKIFKSLIEGCEVRHSLVKEVNIRVARDSDSKLNLKLGNNNFLPLKIPRRSDLFLFIIINSKIKNNRKYIYSMTVLNGTEGVNDIKDEIVKSVQMKR